MKVFRSAAECQVLGRPAAVTIGAYDGIHAGHQQVIGQVRDMAHAEDLAAVVVTFDRHPASVVRPESAPLLLTDLEQKLELLADTGIDACLVVKFDEARAAEPAPEFVQKVLVDGLSCKTVIVGEDFHFGHRRQGNVALLREIGQSEGFDVRGLSLVGLDGEPARDHNQVSSTAIRMALTGGFLEQANAYLTRPYEVRGEVGTGNRQGRELGFPTANVAVPEQILLPADGVYAGWYERPNGERHMAAISLGTRPTFYADDGKLLLEAHLLDFDGDLYDERARVQFTHYLRGQVRFDGLEPLVAQLHEDIDATRAALT